MFVDSVEISVSSGNGGAGATSFRREKHVIQGGPDGGDGGDGGDVYVEVVENNDTLSKYRGAKIYKAKNGEPGMPKKCSGKRGIDLVLKVPLGTQILDIESNEILLDMTENKKVLLLKGGKGGLGNLHFKNSINQAPTYAQPGLKGESRNLKLTLKLIADVGLVGFPNVGKSTLISTISNATPEIANYEFTTLVPNLGVVDVDEFKSFVMADIPGIIEGASSGKGLGIEFLRHIERTKILLLVLDVSNYRDIKEQFSSLKNELAIFSQNTNTNLENRAFGVVLSKIDTLEDKDMLKDMMEHFIAKSKTKYERKSADTPYLIQAETFGENKFDTLAPLFVLPLSSASHINTKLLPKLLNKYL